jgi:hypothetical protein
LILALFSLASNDFPANVVLQTMERHRRAEAVVVALDRFLADEQKEAKP